MYPQLPENLAELNATDLRNLAKEFRAARRQAATDNPQMTAEQFSEWETAGATASLLDHLADDADADAAADATIAAAAAAEEAAAAEAAAAEEAAAADDTESDDDDDDTGDDDGGDTDGEHSGGEITVHETLPTGLALESSEGDTMTRTQNWVATGAAGSGVDRGYAFADTVEIGEAVQSVMTQMAAGDNDKRVIATMDAHVTDAQRISGDQLFVDMARLTNPDEIEAAFCTPLTPLYALACANVTRRPVFGGLPTFVPDANRGGFRVPSSPSLTDITGGFGQWTSVNDADLDAIKAACQTIECVSWSDFEWYATYRCLTVRNMMQMTFPELVDAYLNRLQARWAKYAEVLLLEAMGTASTSVDGIAQSYGANVSLTRNILTYLGKYAEIERWDTPDMDAWMPRWLLWALRMDLASRRQDAYVPATVAEVERRFMDIGVTPRWFMDRPSWSTPIAPLSVNGTLTPFPSQVEILLHRRGKFAVMDKGQLSLGLGGNPFRMEDDVRRNQSTFFVESFEGLIDTDSCPAHIVTVGGLCYNGFQIADRKIECEGYDLVGEGSGA